VPVYYTYHTKCTHRDTFAKQGFTTLHHKHPSQLHIKLLTTWTYPTVSINGKGTGKGRYT